MERPPFTDSRIPAILRRVSRSLICAGGTARTAPPYYKWRAKCGVWMSSLMARPGSWRE